VHQRNVTIMVLAGDSVYVIATATPDSICGGEPSQLFARTIKGIKPISFSWTPATGLNNPHIANPVASPLANTLYHVHVMDSVSHTANDSALISIIPTPNTPGTIIGPAIICPDSIAGYSVPIVPNAISYSWTVPVGALILSGQNTPTITVRLATTGGTVSVISGNQCGISDPSVLDVTVTNTPSQPTIIQGPEEVCNEEKITFSVDPVPDATSYFWTVPADATILNGQNTDTINVQWGANGGNITVTALDDCGESTPFTQFISLETLPGPAGTITGNDTVCTNYENYSYTVPVITGANSYTWVVPSGIAITSGTGTNSIDITVSPEATSGVILVEGKNTCGSGTASVTNVTVKICTGIHENKKEPEISVFPNPAGGELNMTITGGENLMDVRITDMRGQVVLRESLNNIPHDFRQTVNVSAFSRGVYFVEVISSATFIVRKIILQ